jgi:hypothetical protein
VCFSYAVIGLLETGTNTRREFVVCFSYAVIGLLVYSEQERSPEGSL